MKEIFLFSCKMTSSSKLSPWRNIQEVLQVGKTYSRLTGIPRSESGLLYQDVFPVDLKMCNSPGSLAVQFFFFRVR
jgi:hypothetical protein